MSRIQQPIDPTAGKRLQELLDEYGIKQKEFAQAMNFSPEYVNRLIKGRQRITPDNAQFFVKQVFTSRDIRWEWLAGLDNCKTFDDYRLKEYHEERMKIRKNIIEWKRREESIDQILHAMHYKIDFIDLLDCSEDEKKEKKEWVEINAFCRILMTENRYFEMYFTEESLAILRDQYESKRWKPNIEYRNNRLKYIVENKAECLDEERKKADKQEMEKYDDQEYCLFDLSDNLIFQFTPQERIDFINQLYDVVTALIQYHITKKKGQP